MALDSHVIELMIGLMGKSRLFDMVGIFFAEWVSYVLIVFLIILIWKTDGVRSRLYWIALTLLSIILTRGIVTEIVRFLYPRMRPYLELGFEPLFIEISSSFPSGHAAFFGALATIVLLMNYRAGLWVWATVIVMGCARIFAGVHWVSDIIAGFGVGILSVLVIRALIQKLYIRDVPHDENVSGATEAPSTQSIS